MQFVHARNYEERKKILRGSLLISQEEIIPEMILNYINDVFDDNNSKKDLLEHYRLLIEIRKDGPGLLVDFHSSSEIELSFAEFSDGFNTLLERKIYLQNNLFLLNDKSVSEVNSLISNGIAKYGISISTNLRLYSNLLKACRLMPIEEAFKDFEVPEERFVNALNSFLAAQSPYDITKVMGRYGKEFREPPIRNVFMFFQARFQDKKDKVERLKIAWGFISNFQSNKDILWFE